MSNYTDNDYTNLDFLSKVIYKLDSFVMRLKNSSLKVCRLISIFSS